MVKKTKKKLSSGFGKIKITKDKLSSVTDFKAITTRGKKRPKLKKKEHKKLVKEKFQVATKMDDHITLFRVGDKNNLAGKEIKEHTVPGPVWTPPSSVGFVMGGLSQGHRVWLATSPTESGLKGEDGKPSIYARETSTALQYGWSPRASKDSEKYGKTKRGPEVVLTPPSSPRIVEESRIKSIMDVDSSWEGLGESGAKTLAEKLTPESVKKLKEIRQKLDKKGTVERKTAIVTKNSKVTGLSL